MSKLIVEHSLGYGVYGVEQFDYTVDNIAGCTFGSGVTKAVLFRAAVMDDVLKAYSDVVRLRQKKLDDMAKALSIFSAESASFSEKDETDTKHTNSQIYYANTICQKYGLWISSYSFTGDTIEKGQIQQVCTCIRYEIDRENTEMQQDMVQVQSYVSKRDGAYDLANKVQDRTNSTISMGIRNIH